MPKMKRATIVKFSLDELAGVDAGAQAEAGTVVLKRKDQRSSMVSTMKRAALTSAVLGHTHMLNGIDDMQSGCTSSERHNEGVSGDSYAAYHSHPWVRTEGGAIVLGEVAGHTHEVTVASAPLVKSAIGKSTTAPAIPTVKHTNAQELPQMTTKIVVLTEAQHAHFSKLTTSDAEAFVAKSSLERDVEVTKAREADPVVFTGEVTKMQVRRSDGPRFLELAQQNETNAVASKRSLEMAEAEKAARELTELTKRANETIGNLPGTEAAKRVLLGAAESITDATLRGEAVQALKAANGAFKMLAKTSGAGEGAGGEPTGGNPIEAWNAAVATYAEKSAIKDIGAAADKFLGTPEGRAAKRSYDKASVEYRRQHEHDGDDA